MPSKSDSKSLIKTILAADSFGPNLLVICPDRLRRERLAENFFKKFIPRFDSASGRSEILTVINAAELNLTSFAAFADSYNSLSLFAPESFYWIKNVQDLPTALNKKLIDLLESPNNRASVLLTADKLAANSVILNFHKKQKRLVELEELKGPELQRWVVRELKNQDISEWDEIVPEALIQCCASSPEKIYELVTKLSLYLDGGKATLEDLNAISSFAPDANEFTLLDNLPNKNALLRSEVLINQIFKSGKSSFALLGLIARNYTNYLYISSLQKEGLSLPEIRQKLKTAPWLFNKQSEASRKFSLQRLQEGLKAILVADSKLKNRSLGDEIIFSELINNL